MFHAEGGDYSKGISPGLSLKSYIISQVESQLTRELKTQQESQNNDDEAELSRMGSAFYDKGNKVAMNLDKIKVADLIFGRDNGSMIHLLKKRGEAIAEQEFDIIRSIEKKINKEIKNNYEQMTTPTSAFIIFEEEEGPLLALRNNKNRNYHMLGSNMKFNAPHMPTDIIWENRGSKNSFRKHTVAFMALLFLLLCSGIVVGELSSWEQ